MEYNPVFNIEIADWSYENENLSFFVDRHGLNMIRWRIPETDEGFAYYLKTFALILDQNCFEIPNATIDDMKSCGERHRWGTFTSGLSVPPAEFCESKDSITVCVMCQNSAKTIEQCLSSVSAWADEVLVLDEGSSDDTLDIVRKYSTEFHQSQWRGDFSLERNLLIEKVRTEWMFMLDSDEVVSGQFGSQLRQSISYCNATSNDVIWIPRHWLFRQGGVPANNTISNLVVLQGHWLFWPDPQARIARMEKRPYYSGRLHEVLHLRDNGRALLLCWAEIALYHLCLLNKTFNERQKIVNERNSIDEGGAHVIQLLPEKWKFVRSSACPVVLSDC